MASHINDALLVSAERGDVESLRLLLAHGADLEAEFLVPTRSRHRRTFLTAACADSHRSQPGLKKLLPVGFSPFALPPQQDGSTPLIVAAFNGSANCIPELIAAGVRIDAVKKTTKSSALHMAVYGKDGRESVECVRELLPRVVDIDIKMKVRGLAQTGRSVFLSALPVLAGSISHFFLSGFRLPQVAATPSFVVAPARGAALGAFPRRHRLHTRSPLSMRRTGTRRSISPRGGALLRA